jgi:hypothetical protein
VSKRLFVSIELEGRWYGTPTLFVEGNVPVEAILAAAQQHVIKHVYFGAVYKGKYGSPSYVSPLSVKAVLDLGLTVTVEALSPCRSLIDLSRTHIMYMVPAFAFSSWLSYIQKDLNLWKQIQVKYMWDGNLVVVGFDGPYVTKPEAYKVDEGTVITEYA